jgi:hypothetical protein
MPALTYSQYQDPQTGEIIWLPQLYPHAKSTREMSYSEIEAWVSAGIIPRELYESEIQSQKKIIEIRNRIQKGEEVLASELPDPVLFTEYLLKNKARLYGENVLTKIFSMLDESDPDIVWLSYVKESVNALKATDPQQIHQYISRTILKDKYNIEDTRAVDLLARSLLEHCCNMTDFKSFQHPAFNKLPIDISDLHDHLKHEKEQILQIDMDFVTYLKKIGAKGTKLATEVQKNCIELFEFYEKENYLGSLRRQLWGLWVPDNTPINGALRILTQALWEDICFKFWYRETNGASSIVKPIIEKIIIPLLGPKKSKKFIEKDGNIILCNKLGEPLLTAPAVDVNMIAPFKKGVKELGTLTGHKMLRWQVNAGFERWAKGENDPRLIEIDGGYSRIAEFIGCRHPSEIVKVRDILHAQAHGYFKFADGSHGNMIILNILNTHRNSEPSKIRIILGDMLLPTYVHQIERSERRLIPIGDIPPLSGGSPDTYAAQAQLQLLVFCEFSNQSIRLAQTGSVLLPTDWWIEKALEAGLNPEKVKSVIEHWCQPDFFNCFLEKQGDEYRLANYYTRQQKFLENQGLGRIENSEKGKKSAEKRKKLKKS